MTQPDRISDREMGEFMGRVLMKLEAIEEKINTSKTRCEDIQDKWHPRIETIERMQVKIQTAGVLIGFLLGSLIVPAIKFFWKG